MTTYHFTKRSTNVPSAGIEYMMQYGSKYRDIISLGQGTPLFPTPHFIYEELYKRSLNDRELGMYASSQKKNKLINLICTEMKELYGFTPREENIYLTVGGIGGLFCALMALIEKGDEVIYFDASYPLHLSQIHIAQARPVFVPYIEEKGWKIDIEKLKSSITPHTRLVILTNPNNPTGTVLSESEVRELVTIVIDNNILLVVDEAYGFLTYENAFFSPLSIPQIKDHVILCKSFSKEYAMTGWRIGYVYAPASIIKKISDIHVYFSISPSTVSIVAASIALSDPRGKKAMNQFIHHFSESRETICNRLDDLPQLFSYQKPQGAYYVFPRIISTHLNSLDFAKLLVDKVQLITIPGYTMGPSGEHHVRMSFAAEKEVINTAFDRIDVFAKNMNRYVPRVI